MGSCFILFLVGLACVVISAVLFLHILVNNQFQSPNWHNVQSITMTVTTWGQIYIEVSPMAYPISGQSWKIFVYSVNVSSGEPNLSQLANSSVAVYVKELGVDRTYNLTVDGEGKAEFPYLPDYTDVAFQAFSGNYSSGRVVVSTHYVSSQVVDTMLSASSLASLVIGIPAVWARVNRKMRTSLSVLFIIGIVLLLLVVVLAFYCKLFLGTVWGYPESLFGFVTLNLLNYLTMFGVILTVLFVLSLISFILHSKK